MKESGELERIRDWFVEQAKIKTPRSVEATLAEYQLEYIARNLVNEGYCHHFSVRRIGVRWGWNSSSFDTPDADDVILRLRLNGWLDNCCLFGRLVRLDELHSLTKPP